MQDNYEHINKLVEACKNDDSKALFELYDFYKPLLLSSVSRCIYKNPKLSRYRDDIFSQTKISRRIINIRF